VTAKRTTGQSRCGISWASYTLPASKLTIADLARRNLITSSPAQLADLGFRRVHVAQSETAYTLAQSAIERILKRSQCDARAIDVLIHASALPDSQTRVRRAEALFRYPGPALQYHFGFTRASVFGVAQTGCVSLLNSIRLARDIIAAEPQVNRILCVSADVLPRNTKREILYNLISDGAAAVLVDRDSDRNRIVAYSQITKGVYWESDQQGDEIVAAYFSSARTAMHDALQQAGLQISDIALVLPHNVNRRSWEILCQLMEIPKARLFSSNIASKGHTIAADNVINLCDAEKRGRLKPGDHLMLFSFGFGAHWACMIVRH
jgi:3-oxoacyl-[acyl-carrier-protein] synthase-3